MSTLHIYFWKMQPPTEKLHIEICVLYGYLIIWHFMCVVNACLCPLLCKSRNDMMANNVVRKKFLHSKLCEEFVHHHGNQLIMASWRMHQVRINHFETVKHCSKWTHKIWKTNETQWNTDTHSQIQTRNCLHEAKFKI